jgi:hypothetical protein
MIDPVERTGMTKKIQSGRRFNAPPTVKDLKRKRGRRNRCSSIQHECVGAIQATNNQCIQYSEKVF